MITGSVSSSPVSTTVQVVVLPLPSSAVMVMLCVVPSPEAMVAPAIGDCVISTEASQLSVATASATRSGTVIWQVAFSGSVRSAGQVVITGSVSSITVSKAPLLFTELPSPSVTTQRYRYPFIPSVTPVMDSVAVVAPEKTPPLLISANPLPVFCCH